MTEQNKMLIEELEKRLLWYREEASADEFDADEVDAICTMLLKLSPERKPRRTKEEAYQNILRQISSEEENSEGKEADYRKADDERAAADGSVEESAGDGSGKRRRFFAGKRLLRAAVIFLAALGVLASLNMVSYARENKSLFTMILERVGWLKIEKEATDNTSAGLTKSAEEFYDSWAELDRGTKERISVPGYIPEGYYLYGIKYWNMYDREILQAEYYDQGNGHLLIEITLWDDSEQQYRENATDEKKCVLIPEYSNENTLYYSYADEYICMIFRESSFYRISGNIRLEEMVKIGEGM